MKLHLALLLGAAFALSASCDSSEPGPAATPPSSEPAATATAEPAAPSADVADAAPDEPAAPGALPEIRYYMIADT